MGRRLVVMNYEKINNRDLLAMDRILKDQMWRAAVSICSNIADQ
jgi:four helix bundle protein